MKPCECYKFESCNAPVCPLEPDVGAYVQGEKAICAIQLRRAKGFMRPQDGDLVTAVAAGWPRVEARFPRIAAICRRSSAKPVKVGPTGQDLVPVPVGATYSQRVSPSERSP